GAFGVIAFLVFEWLVVVGTSNACNITDGLDGLAAGCMIITGFALTVFCYVTGRPDWTSYLNLPHVGAASEMPIVGLLAWMALVAKQELVLPLIGFVFFAELGSSWLQTQYFRGTGGKRLFTVAPIHHGLQLKGGVFSPGTRPWHEATIVVRAWILAGICAIVGLSLMKVR